MLLLDQHASSVFFAPHSRFNFLRQRCERMRFRDRKYKGIICDHWRAQQTVGDKLDRERRIALVRRARLICFVGLRCLLLPGTVREPDIRLKIDNDLTIMNHGTTVA